MRIVVALVALVAGTSVNAYMEHDTGFDRYMGRVYRRPSMWVEWAEDPVANATPRQVDASWSLGPPRYADTDYRGPGASVNARMGRNAWGTYETGPFHRRPSMWVDWAEYPVANATRMPFDVVEHWVEPCYCGTHFNLRSLQGCVVEEYV